MPKYFISAGAVRMPTISNVVQKQATAVTLAPACSSEPARGNATKAGINVMDPTRETMISPNRLRSLKRVLMVSGGSTARENPKIPIIPKIEGKRFIKDFLAIFNALIVLCLSLIQDISRHIPVIIKSPVIKLNNITSIISNLVYILFFLIFITPSFLAIFYILIAYQGKKKEPALLSRSPYIFLIRYQ
ncbi:hypothetical protein N752_09295 [Desulforamulus aquiferis]|nr:hypothetical protein N752_09295 [Desulforamulus aquiferis]